MSAPTIPSPRETPSSPRLVVPPLGCDSHCHVFGPVARFPYQPDRTYTPPDIPESRLRRLHDALGFARAVIVQGAPHGADHAALLAALAAGQGRYRGVGLPSLADAPDLARLHEAGMRGIRFNFLPHLGAAPDPRAIADAAAKVVPLGWHVAIHVMGDGIADISPLLAELRAPVVIDHMARVRVEQGADGAAFVALRRLLQGGRVWVKLSGLDRVSREPWPHADAVALARMLAADAPDRVLWGSDFPHPNIAGEMPDDGRMLDLAAVIAPDAGARARMLVDNPASLFGF